MGLFLVIALTYVTFVLQTSVVPLVDWGAFAPQIVLAGLVGMTIRSNGRNGLLIAAAWGALSDGLSRGPLGVDLVLFVLAAWCCQAVYSRRPPDSALTPAALTGFVVFAVRSASAGVRALCEHESVDLNRLVAHAAGPAFSTALLVLIWVLAWRIVGGPLLATGRFHTSPASDHWRLPVR